MVSSSSGSIRSMALLVRAEEEPVGQEFVGESEIPAFMLQRPRKTVWRQVAGVAAALVGVSLAALCLLPGHHMAGMVENDVALPGDRLTPKHFLGKPAGQKPSKLISMASDDVVDNIICDKYPYFKVLEVTSSNLGGHGPDEDAPEGIIYQVQNTMTSELMELRFSAVTDYSPEIVNFNGCAGLKRLSGKECADRFSAFNLKAGTEAEFTLTFHDAETKEPKTVHHAAITWFDIDENLAHTNRETVSMSGFQDFKLEGVTNVTTSVNGSMTNWMSTSYGDGNNNPIGPAGLTPEQKQLSVTVFYDNVNSMQMRISAGGSGVDENGTEVEAMPRFFTFILMPSIPCARTLLPALRYKLPDETPVEATGEFYKWKKKIGDPVEPGDVIALIRTDDGIENIIAPDSCKGHFLKRQPFKIGDIMEERMEKQPIAVCFNGKVDPLCKGGQCSLLPALPVGDGQVAVPEEGMFVNWTVSKDTPVNEGDVIGYKNVTDDGPTVPILATYVGRVTDMQPFKPGEIMEDRMEDQPVAVITSIGSLPVAHSDEPVPIPDGDSLLFVEYKKHPGDPVKQGDVVATLKTPKEGQIIEALSPKDGFVKSYQTLTPNAEVNKIIPDGNLAVIQDEARLMPLSYENADCVESQQDGVLFKKFLVDVPQSVTVGTPIAIVTYPDGVDKLLLAPVTGEVKALQALQEKDDLGEVMWVGDQCIATIRPHAGAAGKEDVYTTLAPNNFPNHTVFEEWVARDGAYVNMGDLIARVQPPKSDQQAKGEVYAHTSGYLKLSGLNMGDDMQADAYTISSASDEHIEISMDVSDLEDGTQFKEWNVGVGDKVRPGDKIATVSAPDGQQVVTAFRGGWVTEIAGLRPGDFVKRELGSADFAKIVTTPGVPGAHYYPVDEALLPEGTTFQEFLVKEGDEVKKFDPVVKVRTPGGEDVILTAGHDGIISELAGVADFPGASLTELLPLHVHSLATVLVEPVSEGATLRGGGEQVPSRSSCIHAVPGDLLTMWYRSESDPVSEGNTVVTVQRGGETIELKSPRDGFVSSTAKIDDGSRVDEDSASPIFCVEDPKVEDTEVQAALGKEGDIFVTWVEQVDDFVTRGDTICVVTRDGRHTPIKAGTTGKIVFEQLLKPGDSLEKGEYDPMFLIQPLIPPFKETGGSTQPTNVLLRWMRKVGDPVKRGETVAMVQQDGENISVTAPQDGEVSFKQNIGENQEIPEDKGSPLFLIKNPNPLPAKIHGASAVPEDKLMSWEKKVGDPVKEGDVVATALRNAQVVEVKSPRDGHVYFEQPLKAGDRISEPDHSPLFQIEGADPVGSTAQGQAAEPTDVLVEWRHKMGDRVEKHDIVAVITRNGNQLPVQAPKEGWVSYTAPVNVNEQITDENSRTLFDIDDGPYNPLPQGTGQSTQPGDRLLRWHNDVGDDVREGALVATIDRNGVEIPVYAPKDGDLTFKQPVKNGEAITPENSNPLFIVTEPPKDLPQGVAVKGKPGDKFVEWKKSVPEGLAKGEVVAVVERDGELVELAAPNGGHLSYKQPLEPGDEIDSHTDSPLFLVDRRTHGAEGSGIPINAPNAKKLGYSSIRFKNWAVAPGDHVKTGDVIAVVELVPAGAERRRLSESGRRLTSSTRVPKEIEVLSPAPGCVSSIMDLYPGGVMEDNYASLTMAKIGWCPFPWSLWLLLLLFLICCCLCCCAFVAMKKRREEKYSTMKPIGDTAAVAAGKKPKFDKPNEPVTFDFEDTEGRIHSYRFTHRPLGIVYEKDRSPVQVQRCKFNSYARWMGVKEGWIIKKILRTDVTYKSVEEVEELTYSYLRDKPIWPLRLDFKKPLPRDAPPNPYANHNDGYARRSVSFMVDTQPIGIEFYHKLPMIISKIYPNTYAADHNIQEQWKLVGIGYNSNKDEPLLDLEEDPEELDYKDIMRKFRDGVSLLDLREDNQQILTNRQVWKWEENLGEETTNHQNHVNHERTGGFAARHSATSRSRTGSKTSSNAHNHTGHVAPL